MNELDQFKDTYITEAFELLEEMEEKLLSLDNGEVDIDEINAIFRCAHSIKGGAGAFGFDKLVKFTHNLEALLDAMREEKVDVTTDTTDALLKSVDIVSRLVVAAQEGSEMPEDFGEELSSVLAKMANVEAKTKQPAQQDEPLETEKEFGFYDIKFSPYTELFASGNEPLLIIRELKRIGNVSAETDTSEIPDLEVFNPEECYLKWRLEVETDHGIDAINEAFEFVEDECNLEIEEFGAISIPPEPDLADEDEFGGIFVGAMDDIASSKKEVKKSSKILSPEKKKQNAIATNTANNISKTPSVTSIRVDIEKVDALVNMVGELVITQSMIVNQIGELPHKEFHRLIAGVEEMSRHTRNLQESVMSVRMQPVKSIFARMPRIVRDLSRQLGKDIRIIMKGENTEIDKTVIEQLGDPLTHMIRNSVDHGIESPEKRKKRGKPAQGTITLSADNSGGRIIIEIEDDGAGIDRAKVLNKAIEKGIVSDGANLSDEEIDMLVFRAGFSTADKVTNVSGRGVGMDVVKRNIEELGGNISMINIPNSGSRFSVSLPLTLAILDGMIIRVGKENYIIPINNILESLSADNAEIKTVADSKEVINIRGNFIPILYLNRIFNVLDDNVDSDKKLVVLVESGHENFGLVVDEIIGQQQVVIKSLEENSAPVEGVSGATILGDGHVSLILDIAKLQKMSHQDSNGNLKTEVKEAA